MASFEGTLGKGGNRRLEGALSFNRTAIKMTYEGSFNRNGKPHGQGKMGLPDGSLYEGEFQDGEIQGIGLRTYPDSSSYSGAFESGERQGEGVFLGPNPDHYRYEGTFASNKMHGEGELVFGHEGKDHYAGDFYDNNFHGRGILTLGSGIRIEGTFVRGKPEGHCKVEFEGGQTYEGEMLQGSRCGLGTLNDGNGFHYEGNWVNDGPAEPAVEIVKRADDSAKVNDDGDENAPMADDDAAGASEQDQLAHFITDEDGNTVLECKCEQRLPTLSFDVISGYREVEPEQKTAEEVEAEEAAAAAAAAEAKSKKGKKGKGGKRGKSEEEDGEQKEEKEPERVLVLCTAEEGRPFVLVARMIVEAAEAAEGNEAEGKAKDGEEVKCGEEAKKVCSKQLLGEIFLHIRFSHATTIRNRMLTPTSTALQWPSHLQREP